MQCEIKYIEKSDSFLFVNEYLANKYANGKKYAVSYGNCDYHRKIEFKKKDTIDITYTGIINEERGVFILLDAMKHLPNNFRLNVLGFGSKYNMSKFLLKIEELNKNFGFNKITFLGTKSGEEYSDFLFQNEIGISLIDTDNEVISNHSFPSKIMVYLCHGLKVVSTDCESIKRSKISSLLHYCKNNEFDIANAIKNVDLSDSCDYERDLIKLENDFLNEFKEVLEVV